MKTNTLLIGGANSATQDSRELKVEVDKGQAITPLGPIYPSAGVGKSRVSTHAITRLSIPTPRG